MVLKIIAVFFHIFISRNFSLHLDIFPLEDLQAASLIDYTHLCIVCGKLYPPFNYVRNVFLKTPIRS